MQLQSSLMQFLLVGIHLIQFLQVAIRELSNSILVKIQLESSLIQLFLVTITIAELSN